MLLRFLFPCGLAPLWCPRRSIRHCARLPTGAPECCNTVESVHVPRHPRRYYLLSDCHRRCSCLHREVDVLHGQQLRVYKPVFIWSGQNTLFQINVAVLGEANILNF
ncbi:hypothetical protein FB451DRAFT_1175135 [Mycena latifolia]|nr:hypothetical protein FB451DRAFT_1175135 [Mycena latifolia]